MTPLELLAPARTADIAVKAIEAGADAVYIGASSHGARHAAANSIDDIARVVEAAHPFGAKVYATVNTIIYDDELPRVERLVADLWRIGVDALIVQDLGLLRADIPPIELHASTQCDIRTPEKARFLASVGFSRLVVARELSLKEIEAIRQAIPQDVEIEAFIHGALCVSYSGDCRASAMAGGRSANRGECAQICRLPFDLVDSQGRKLIENKHLLSLKDLNRSASIADMARAGVQSFKIEGRLKEADYVVNAVAHYSGILDRVVEASDSQYCRLSHGRSRCNFSPDPAKGFNRGFTPYFLSGHSPKAGIAAMHTPKQMGEKVGRVVSSAKGRIIAALDTPLANGDGLGYFDRQGQFKGFRLNRIEGQTLFPATPLTLPGGTVLYRNRDKEWSAQMAAAKCTRTMTVDMALSLTPDCTRAALQLTDRQGISATATVTLPSPATEAATPQERPRRAILSKLGGTIFAPGRIVDLAGERFIPASSLAALRRDAVALLEKTLKIRYKRGLRREERFDVPLPQGTVLTYHDNVANRLAEQFYRSHGATEIAPALEVKRPEGEVEVMQTRYCLRREMGCCLKTPEGKRWPSPLYLVNPTLRLRLDFDCTRCGMNIIMEP